MVLRAAATRKEPQMLTNLNPIFALKSWTIKKWKEKFYIAPSASEGKQQWFKP
jgi:hypothetical protein